MKRLPPLLGLLFLGWLTAEPVGADSKEVHKLGVEAVEAGRWADAERFFRTAIEERSEEKINRFLKTTYLPHYYLGIALAEQGKCRPAIDAWTESLSQQQVQRSKQLDNLNQRSEQCRSYLRQVEAAAMEVEQTLATVGVTANSLATLGETPELAPLWDQGSPSFSERQRQASQRLADARQSFDQGKSRDKLDLLDSSKVLANQAQSDFEAAVTAAHQRLGDLNAATGEALQKLEQAEISARRVLRSIADLAPYPSGLGARVANLERNLQAVVDSKSGANAAGLDQLTDDLTVAMAALRRAARRPPEKLRRAVEAFFATRFEEVLELTEDDKLAKNSRAQAHICLLRAASRHALWVFSGEAPEMGRELIAPEVLACAELDPPLAPDTKFFSPRFVALHAEILAEQHAATGDDSAPQNADAPTIVPTGAAEANTAEANTAGANTAAEAHTGAGGRPGT